jgi:hypothetical protein
VTSPRSSSPSGDGSRSQLQGAVLIGVAVVIGLVLLLRGFDQDDGGVASGDDPAATTTTVAGQPTTTTTVASVVRPPAQVSVLVANGTGVGGVAGAKAAILSPKGYTTVATTNAPSTATSAVYYAAGYQAEAEAVAQALGIPATAVAALPASPPVDPAGSSVVVVVGSDLA